MVERGNSLAQRDIGAHLHPFTNLKQHEADGPLVMDRGEGIYVFDDTGRRYIEAMSGLWCTSLGFGEQRLVAAASRQMARLPFNHTFRGRSHESIIELADRLVAMAPGKMSKACFANSGSEANDTAIKLIWYYNNAIGRPAKRKIISRHKAYHGTTVATASLTGFDDFHADFNIPLPGILYAGCPHHWRHAKAGESEDEFADRLARELDELIQREGAGTVAAFIAEPVMGVGGVIVPPRSYFPKIQAVLRRHDVLMIADEVICAFGRTGQMFGSQTLGIEPDMVTMAKSLSSAYVPISALLISEPIYRTLVSQSVKLGLFAHGYTYSGHPVGAAVALEALNIYRERDIVAHVRKVGARLQNGLRALADRPIVGEVRGLGLMAAIELVADKASKTPFAADKRVAAFLARAAQDQGVIIRPIDQCVVMAPPLIITESEIDDLLGRLARALDETAAAFHPGLARGAA